MKNKVILSFLIIPIIFACQNNNVNVSSSPEPSKSNIIPTSSPTNTIRPTVTPTTNVVLSPSPSITPINTPTPLPTIDADITPIIESNMYPERIINELLPELPKEPLGEYFEIRGFVYDRNSNPVSDANVEIVSQDKYRYKYMTKTDLSGEYITIIPIRVISLIGRSYFISINKEGWTKTNTFMTVNDRDNNGYGDERYFGGKKGVSKGIDPNPELQGININGNKVISYNYFNNSLKLLDDVESDYISLKKIKKDVILPKFKIQSTNILKIELKFNNSIKRESIENNLVIQSLYSELKYDINTKSSVFKWFENDKKVVFECPINIQKEDRKYRISFTKPFIDSNSREAYQGEYISLDIFSANYIRELSENIIFEIAGSK